MERTMEKERANPHWSFSALNTYLNGCSLKFYFQYIEHAPPERTSSCFAFGRAFHAALSAQAYRAKIGQSLSEKEGNDLFADFFSAEVKAVENLVYKPKETYDSLLETVSEDLKMLYLKNDNEARSVIVRAAEFGAINSSDILPVFHEFKKPRHTEFEEPTRWSLLNAFTETVKKYTPQRVDHSYATLTRCFGLDGKQPQLWS